MKSMLEVPRTDGTGFATLPWGACSADRHKKKWAADTASGPSQVT